MAHREDPAKAHIVAFRGEVWTDGRGFATVQLPAEAAPLEPPLAYELRDVEPPSSARVTAELSDGRFTIKTREPHVKVAWRLIGQHSADGVGDGRG